jgi:Uma2 family endonuclease
MVRADRFSKRRLYQEVRIPVYWIVDTDKRLVDVWTPDAEWPVVERRSASHGSRPERRGR